jgi:hypothetical protein
MYRPGPGEAVARSQRDVPVHGNRVMVQAPPIALAILV